jgi:tetratricopeptide (TPR) repeat protein
LALWQKGQKTLANLVAVVNNAYTALMGDLRERYAVQQLYANAMIEKGRMHEAKKEQAEATAAFEEAMRLFTACAEIDEKRRKLLEEEMDREYVPIVSGLKARIRGADDVLKVIKELKDELKRQGLDPNDNEDLPSAIFAYEYIRKATTPVEEKDRLPQALRAVQTAWDHHVVRVKRRLIVDSVNVIGRARALWGLKKHNEALVKFVEYVDGIDREKYGRMYWEGQLERVRCQRDAVQGNPAGLKNLGVLIKQLGLEDRNYGGLSSDFMSILGELPK